MGTGSYELGMKRLTQRREDAKARRKTLSWRWTAAGAVDDSPLDPDMINDSVAPILAALEPRAAAELCLRAAAEADAEVAALSPAMTAAIEQAMAEGRVFMRLDRGLHRAGHLADIERALSG